jgi:glycosyltransferase involved in cell wall biosynthesis
MQKKAIIIPCYNESKRLKFDDFLDYIKKNESVTLIFINDGSTENTLEIIYQLCELAPERILCKSLEKNQGKAEAVRQGFLMAFKSDFKIVGYWDADLSTPLYLIDKMCEQLEGDRISIVMGSRVRLLGYNIERLAIRHYLGRIFATLASLILELHVYDTQCGAKIFTNNSELKKVFAHPFYVKWIFDVEILARFRIVKEILNSGPLENTALECPLEKWSDIRGSKVRFFDFLKAALELAKIYLLLNFPLIGKKYFEKFKE